MNLALRTQEPTRVLPGDFERKLAHIDGRDCPFWVFERECDSNATTPRPEIQDVVDKVDGQRRLDEDLRLLTGDQDVRIDLEPPTEELSPTEDIGQWLAHGP